MPSDSLEITTSAVGRQREADASTINCSSVAGSFSGRGRNCAPAGAAERQTAMAAQIDNRRENVAISDRVQSNPERNTVRKPSRSMNGASYDVGAGLTSRRK